MRTRFHWVAAFITCLLSCGCAKPRIVYPDVRLSSVPARGTVELALDMTGNGVSDYVQTFDGPLKRAFRIDRDGSARYVDWRNDDLGQMDHLVLVLDGLPFSLMDEMWREGSFRLFYPPGRMIGPFPSLTAARGTSRTEPACT
jgi:hypothetical protein